jgi:uncharacterized protein (DUF486 family)
MKALMTVGLLVASNVFMTLAWYGHLKFKEYDWGKNLGLVTIIFISWGLAFFEYILQVPANRIGSREMGGPFSLIQLKIIQEAITLIVFTLFTVIFFKHESLKWNHFLAMGLVLAAVYLVFRES